MAHFHSMQHIPRRTPSSFSFPSREHHWSTVYEACVSSIRIIPGGIGFPLLPCSLEPCSCPFLILSALTSRCQWTKLADKGPLCPRFKEGNEGDRVGNKRNVLHLKFKASKDRCSLIINYENASQFICSSFIQSQIWYYSCVVEKLWLLEFPTEV